MFSINFFELLWTKTVLQLRSEVERTYLSYAWWIIEPFSYVLTFYLIFDVLELRGRKDWLNFLMVGIVHWFWFAKSVGQAANSVVSNNRIIQTFHLPVIIFPLSSVLAVTLKQIPLILLLYVFDSFLFHIFKFILLSIIYHFVLLLI